MNKNIILALIILTCIVLVSITISGAELVRAEDLAELQSSSQSDTGVDLNKESTAGVSPNISYVRETIETATTGIYGTVTEGGVPVEDIGISLYKVVYENGSSHREGISSTNTLSDGSFSFINIPTLQPDEEYYAEFFNSDDDVDRLSFWETRHLTEYETGTDVQIGDFDIGEVYLLTPEYGAELPQPYNFTWQVRAYSPSDSYRFKIFTMDSDDEYISPYLGFVGSYQLGEVPEELSIAELHIWYIRVHSPDGGMGYSLRSYRFYFVNTNNSQCNWTEFDSPTTERLWG